jgi:excisionase family DNA binding protein
MAQKLLTLDEAAARLGISSDELMQLVEQRKVFAIKDGGSWKFKADEVDRFKAEISGASSGDAAYYLPVDSDESQDDGGLVSDVLLGGAGPSSSTIIGPSGDQLLGHDSDLTLGGSSGSGLGSDSDVKLVPDELDSGSGGSGLKLVPNVGSGGPGSDLQMVDLDSGSDTFKIQEDADATIQAKPGSSLKLGGSSGKLGGGSKAGSGSGKTGPGSGKSGGKPGSGKLGAGSDLTISESGLSLGEDDDVTIGGSSSAQGMNSSKVSLGDQFDDDDIVLGGASSGLGSGIGDSGINLAAAADSGLSLEEPLELGGDDGVSDDSGETDMASDDDFLLTPMLELDDQDSSDSSGSQVIALDTETIDDQAATLLGSDPLAGAGMMATPGSQAMGPGPMMMQQPAQPQAQYSGLWIGMLVATFLVVALTGMMMFEMIRDIWSWDGPSAASTALMDGIIGIFEGK